MSQVYGSVPDMSSMPPMTGVPGMSGLSAFGGAPPIMTLKRSWGNRIAILLLLMPFGLAALVGAAIGLVGAVEAKHSDDLLPMLFGASAGGLVGLLLLGLGAWLFWREQTRNAALYDAGIALKKGASVTEIRWSDVSEVGLSAVRVRNYGHGGLLVIAASAAINAMRGKSGDTLDSATNVSLAVKSSTGDAIKLTKADAGVIQAWQEVCRRVNPRLIEQAAAQLASGAPLTFGRVSISGAGISFNQKPPIPWSDVSVVSVENGQLVARRDGKRFALGSVGLGFVPNVYVLTEMIRRIAGSTTRVDAPWGQGLVRVQ